MRMCLLAAAAFLALGGCGSAVTPDRANAAIQDNGVAPEAVNSNGSPAVAPSPPIQTLATNEGRGQSCADEIGREEAEKLVRECRNLSPATHPPCNVDNSCAMIRGEITRSEKFNAGTATTTDHPIEKVDQGDMANVSPADVIRLYYAAIDKHDFATAYYMWGKDGQASGKSFTAFSRGFSHTTTSKVTVGAPGGPQGAAGSVYVSVPVTVQATLEDGTSQRFKGSYDLRRSNISSGSASSQQWRLHSASLRRVD